MPFQRMWVRSFNKCYLIFNLAMKPRITRFRRSEKSHKLNALLRLAFAAPTPNRLKLACETKSDDPLYKRYAVRRKGPLQLIVRRVGFRYCVHLSLVSGCFSLSLTYCSLSRHKSYLAFDRWSFRSSDRISRVPPLLNSHSHASYTGLIHPLWLPHFNACLTTIRGSAGPRSLAATRGVFN